MFYNRRQQEAHIDASLQYKTTLPKCRGGGEHVRRLLCVSHTRVVGIVCVPLRHHIKEERIQHSKRVKYIQRIIQWINIARFVSVSIIFMESFIRAHCESKQQRMSFNITFHSSTNQLQSRTCHIWAYRRPKKSEILSSCWVWYTRNYADDENQIDSITTLHSKWKCVAEFQSTVFQWRSAKIISIYSHQRNWTGKKNIQLFDGYFGNWRLGSVLWEKWNESHRNEKWDRPNSFSTLGSAGNVPSRLHGLKCCQLRGRASTCYLKSIKNKLYANLSFVPPDEALNYYYEE